MTEFVGLVQIATKILNVLGILVAAGNFVIAGVFMCVRHDTAEAGVTLYTAACTAFYVATGSTLIWIFLNQL
ncbi:MAG: hypothetical protein VB083_01315 [Aminobacterium sp.]|uniref:hypothetical protein n=1 Tax=Aminobacterium sp. TaxID=1872491 RepID=UPI002B21EE26|nr:hypothetical protein [Aminobacterium sp.]MEA4876530.1 hypothetical protein [Aminobacterium sp.]